MTSSWPLLPGQPEVGQYRFSNFFQLETPWALEISLRLPWPHVDLYFRVNRKWHHNSRHYSTFSNFFSVIDSLVILAHNPSKRTRNSFVFVHKHLMSSFCSITYSARYLTFYVECTTLKIKVVSKMGNNNISEKCKFAFLKIHISALFLWFLREKALLF